MTGSHVALVAANARYWTTIAPAVRRALDAWEERARRIPDPVLRAHALGKLDAERSNAKVTSTLAALAPREHRPRVIAASVALQVMYDYLDAVTEQAVRDPLRNAQHLLRALCAPFEAPVPGVDYYRHHPQRDDGGYLEALVVTCRASWHGLPGASLVAPLAQTVVARCVEAQRRSHAVRTEGIDQLARWATPHAVARGLRWWEFAGGAASSVLTLHALLALAADPRSTAADAERVSTVYLRVCILVTMLDSLVDYEQDLAVGEHDYIGYYADVAEMSDRLCHLASLATTTAEQLQHAAHHVMTVAGIAGFYLSSPGASSSYARPTATRVVEQLRPTITPIMALFRVWRSSQGEAAGTVWSLAPGRGRP